MNELYPKSPVQSSGNRAISRAKNLHLPLAADLARQCGIVPTWPNVQTIKLAIESEAVYSRISLEQAAALIVAAALEFTVFDPSMCSFQAATLLRKANIVNRFWFEDSLWRYKDSYNRMLARLQRLQEIPA